MPCSLASFSSLRRARALALVAGLVGAGPALALSYQEALQLAEQQSPALQAQQSALSGAIAMQGSAATRPDPRLSVGVENLPVSGMDRWSLTRDFMTMQRIALMQDMPNRAKLDARAQGALAGAERERAMLTVARLQLRQNLARAWLALQFNEQRLAVLVELQRQNQQLQDTLQARIAAGSAMASDALMARQESLMLADRHDELQRETVKARAALRRLVGARADEPLEGSAPPLTQSPAQLREQMHQHAELAVYQPMTEMARAGLREAQAENQGDWAWELAYSRRGAQWGDMVSVMLSFELPWQKSRRQQPMIAAKQAELERIEAERAETMRRHAQELDEMLAELAALDSQHARLQSAGLPLAAQRVDLALAGYQAMKGDLSSVLAARRELQEARLRAIDLDAMRADLRARLNTLVAE